LPNRTLPMATIEFGPALIGSSWVVPQNLALATIPG
jgi:hypothetical protein